MLIRFVVKNLFSFKEETEFNLLPSKSQRLNHHKYQKNGIEVLKMTALYGANGSGKSNLIKAIGLFREMLLTGNIPPQLNNQKFKLSKTTQNEPVEIAMEFFVFDTIYYYSIAINNGVVIYEYFSYNDEKEEKLVFRRELKKKQATINFSDIFEEDAESKILKKIIEKDLLKNNQLLFTLLNTISNDAFGGIRNAFHWLEEDLFIIYPESHMEGLSEYIDTEGEFKEFAQALMCSFGTGISSLKVETKNIEDFFDRSDTNSVNSIKKVFDNTTRSIISMKTLNGDDDISFVNENGNIKAKRLFFEHKGEDNEDIEFRLGEESDGTKRLLELLPTWDNLIKHPRTFIIDEIERSIHPIIIKELISKFSEDEQTQGQLIFTTHESNLLDLEIFRQDEIWFAEKKLGATKLSPLSDFKENASINLEKGYLAGRYGGIPFIGDLQNLNWHKFEEENLENQNLSDNVE